MPCIASPRHHELVICPTPGRQISCRHIDQDRRKRDGGSRHMDTKHGYFYRRSGTFIAGIALVGGALLYTGASGEQLNRPPNCSVAAPSSGISASSSILACGYGVPAKLLTSTGKLNLNLFTNKHGKTKGESRTTGSGSNNYRIERDHGGHADSQWKLGKNKGKSQSGWSVRKDGTIRGTKDGVTFSMASVHDVEGREDWGVFS